jgi:hypothetical protein
MQLKVFKYKSLDINIKFFFFYIINSHLVSNMGRASNFQFIDIQNLIKEVALQ